LAATLARRYNPLMGSTPTLGASRENLVRELAKLPPSERRAVVAEAERTAVRRRAVASWSSIRAAIGVVKGEAADAVGDTERLYDE
jgi:hypothetical protein